MPREGSWGHHSTLVLFFSQCLHGKVTRARSSPWWWCTVRAAGREIEQGWVGVTCMRVIEVVTASHGGSFDVNLAVGCKKKEEQICKQGTAREQLEASLYACTLRLESHCLRRNALESVPSLFSHLISSVLQCSNSLFLQPPSALIRLEAPGRFSIPETFVQHRASVTIDGSSPLCS